MPAVAAGLTGITSTALVTDIQDPINDNINLMLEQKGS